MILKSPSHPEYIRSSQKMVILNTNHHPERSEGSLDGGHPERSEGSLKIHNKMLRKLSMTDTVILNTIKNL